MIIGLLGLSQFLQLGRIIMIKQISCIVGYPKISIWEIHTWPPTLHRTKNIKNTGSKAPRYEHVPTSRWYTTLEI